jgi:hypothetical protein
MLGVFAGQVNLHSRFDVTANAYQAKQGNLKAHIALHCAHYNFVRVHQTLHTIRSSIAPNETAPAPFPSKTYR